MKLSQTFGILRARKWTVLAILVATVGIVVVLSLVLPPRYVASVSLVLDIRRADPVTGVIQPVQLLPGYIATQVDVISSHSTALKVVDKLQLTRVPGIREQFHIETGGVGSLRDWLADRLLEQLDVRPSRESSVLEIRYAASDPRMAADMANAFADAYIQTSLELKVDPARRQTGWFEGQVAELREALEKAQQKLSEYQREKGILGAQADRLDVENARLAELSSQLVAAQRAMYEAETRQRQLNAASAQDRIDEIPDIAGNPLVQSLKAELVRGEARLAELGERYDRNHPQYMSAAAEVAALERRLQRELETAKGSIAQAAQIARRQVQELQQALERQRARVLELSQERDTLAVLTRDVENAKAAYDAALQRTAQVRLESQLDQTDVLVLNPAVPPIAPVFPKLPFNVTLAIVLGLFLGCGTALTAEMLNRRVRFRDDLGEIAGLPVLAEIGRLRGRRRSRRALKRAQREQRSDGVITPWPA